MFIEDKFNNFIEAKMKKNIKKWEGNLLKFIVVFLFVGMMLGEGGLSLLVTGHYPTKGPGSEAAKPPTLLFTFLVYIPFGLLTFFISTFIRRNWVYFLLTAFSFTFFLEFLIISFSPEVRAEDFNWMAIVIFLPLYWGGLPTTARILSKKESISRRELAFVIAFLLIFLFINIESLL